MFKQGLCYIYVYIIDLAGRMYCTYLGPISPFVGPKSMHGQSCLGRVYMYIYYTFI